MMAQALRGVLGQQTTPAFSPLSVSGCILWLDASDATKVVSSGGKVSQWTDKSTSANHAVQGTDSIRPLTGVNTKNGLNVITSDDATKYFTLTSGITNTTGTPRTYFIVVRKAAVTNNSVIMGTVNVGTFIGMALSSSSGAPYSRFGAGGDATAGNSLATATYGIVTVTYDRAVDYTTRLNAGTSGSASSVAGGHDFDRIFRYSSAGYHLQGDIGEIVAYNTVLTGTNLTDVRGYLGTKWGISL